MLRNLNHKDISAFRWDDAAAAAGADDDDDDDDANVRLCLIVAMKAAVSCRILLDISSVGLCSVLRRRRRHSSRHWRSLQLRRRYHAGRHRHSDSHCPDRVRRSSAPASTTADYPSRRRFPAVSTQSRRLQVIGWRQRRPDWRQHPSTTKK